jgi:hypothetical protein
VGFRVRPEWFVGFVCGMGYWVHLGELWEVETGKWEGRKRGEQTRS